MFITIKKYFRYFLPDSIYKQYHLYKSLRAFLGLSTKEVFNKIYQEGAWGVSHEDGQRFFSGPGSHDEKIVSVYVEAVTKFLQGFEKKPNVVDLGCGDFNVGSKLRPYCQAISPATLWMRWLTLTKASLKHWVWILECLI